MKNWILYTLLLISCSLFSQVPQGLNYQSVVRDSGGNPMSNQNIGLQFIIHQTSATGTVVYTEDWNTTTDENGVSNVIIGQGTTSDNFSAIDWATGHYYLEILLDNYGGTNYLSMGTSQFISVPYALHAENVTNDAVNDADADPTNEIQDVSSTVNDTNRTLQITGGTSTTINVADNDNDSSNEIQNLSTTVNGTNRTLEISGANSITFNVADNDNDSSNEIQNLSSSATGLNRTINISNGTSTTINIADNDNVNNNELQNLNLNGNTLSLTQGGGAIDLALGANVVSSFSGNETSIDPNGSGWTDFGDFITLEASNNYLISVSFRCKIQGGSNTDHLQFRLKSPSCNTNTISTSTERIENIDNHRGKYSHISFHKIVTNIPCQANFELQFFKPDLDDIVFFDDISIIAIKLN